MDPPKGKSCSVFVPCVTFKAVRVILGSHPLQRICVLLLWPPHGAKIVCGWSPVVSRW